MAFTIFTAQRRVWKAPTLKHGGSDSQTSPWTLLLQKLTGLRAVQRIFGILSSYWYLQRPYSLRRRFARCRDNATGSGYGLDNRPLIANCKNALSCMTIASGLPNLIGNKCPRHLLVLAVFLDVYSITGKRNMLPDAMNGVGIPVPWKNDLELEYS
jgi:hypothetical protein